MRINVIGAGKVGQTLMRLISRAEGYLLGSVYSRQFEAASKAVQSAGAGIAVRELSDMEPADIWFLTVPDDLISSVAQTIAAIPVCPAIVVHCSGFSSSDILSPLKEMGWKTASCHPVRSFADVALAADQFNGTHCAIEGSAGADLWPLVEALGGTPFPVASSRKALYHAAAVFSNNFSTMLQAVAMEAYAEAGVPENVAKSLCKTLLDGAAANVANLGPREALTGPAARGDHAVLAQQCEEVAKWSADAGTLYEVASRMALRLKSEGRAS